MLCMMLVMVAAAGMVSGCSSSTPTARPIDIDTIASDRVVIYVGEATVAGIRKETTILADGTVFLVDRNRTDMAVKRTVSRQTVQSLVNLASDAVTGRLDRDCGTDGATVTSVLTNSGLRSIHIGQPRDCRLPRETTYLAMLDAVAAEVERSGTPAEPYNGQIRSPQ